jgi:hypothetical protein
MITALALLLTPPTLPSAPAERSPGDRICEAYRGWLTGFHQNELRSDQPVAVMAWSPGERSPDWDFEQPFNRTLAPEIALRFHDRTEAVYSENSAGDAEIFGRDFDEYRYEAARDRAADELGIENLEVDYRPAGHARLIIGDDNECDLEGLARAGVVRFARSSRDLRHVDESGLVEMETGVRLMSVYLDQDPNTSILQVYQNEHGIVQIWMRRDPETGTWSEYATRWVLWY